MNREGEFVLGLVRMGSSGIYVQNGFTMKKVEVPGYSRDIEDIPVSLFCVLNRPKHEAYYRNDRTYVKYSLYL